MTKVKRIFVEKQTGFDTEVAQLLREIRDLKIENIDNLRLINVYDCENLSDADFGKSMNSVFSEPPVDKLYLELPLFDPDHDFALAVKYLPGQFNQRADSTVMCIQAVTGAVGVLVESFKLYICEGKLSEKDKTAIRKHLINPVDSMEASLEIPEALQFSASVPKPVAHIEGFLNMNDGEFSDLRAKYGLAMSDADLVFMQDYYKREQRRNPTETEIKMIDTYWSDHCRHTTFLTKIEHINFEDGRYKDLFEKTYKLYLDERNQVYLSKEKSITLMDIATMGMKSLKRKGLLADLDESEEINACSINIDVLVDGKTEEWLLQFKNETHNHPTEIEPFGGAATCLGGAIRDPLSGRAYVYQAMRITGSGDPRASADDTLPGKLPQRKLTQTAALGYSSYGNQIGVATGAVTEIYDEGYIAKRMEIGAVVGAVKKENVVRERPEPGDLIILVGGRTGRDGCGGATGSSKKHNDKSILDCGAEVQKGNPPTERKLQRLFRNPYASKMIKRCNDFGAGGVAVAIGELADGIDIYLDKIPKKYEGLSGTELAISESQERMAVVVAEKNADEFIRLSQEENLEATIVAIVTDRNRLVMHFGQTVIADISRSFLNSSGASRFADVSVISPDKVQLENAKSASIRTMLATLSELNNACQKGLTERFDASVGGLTLLMPFGGKYQLTPAQAMAARIPVVTGKTSTASLMSFGFNPKFAKKSCFHSAVYAVVESVSKIVATGGNFEKTRLSFQEYFESLGSDPKKWGKPFSALLGAFLAQSELGIAAIGGKDSMSGTFNELCVPPTLVSFAVTAVDEGMIVSPEYKVAGNNIYLIKTEFDDNELPNFKQLKENFTKLTSLIAAGKILSAYAITGGGIAASAKNCFGNNIGMKIDLPIGMDFTAEYFGSFIIETAGIFDDFILLGKTTNDKKITINNEEVEISEALKAWIDPLESVFATGIFTEHKKIENAKPFHKQNFALPKTKFARPTVFVPVFPGTNCEYETIRAYENEGAKVISLVMKNYDMQSFKESVKAFASAIDKSQIISIPGGFSAGDEPEGSGKFIAAVFRNELIAEAITKLLNNRDGLMMGICNGFQALVKLGLLPTGSISPITDKSPTLSFNAIGRHISCLSKTIITSKLSPWFSLCELGETTSIATSHGEGRFIITDELFKTLEKNGQIAAQYVDHEQNASMDISHNPNGSMFAIESITSPDGRIMGKMAHTERYFDGLYKNIPGEKLQKLFASGVNYYK